MKKLLKALPSGCLTVKVLNRLCEEHDIRRVKDLVDVYLHRPDLFFKIKSFKKKCWDEISEVLSDHSNPYIPEDSVISFEKAKLIVKRNEMIDKLTGLTQKIRKTK